MKTWTEGKITLLGNIPPRDVLAKGTPEDVRNAVIELMESLQDQSHVILSCGGDMPPGVSTENIQSFLTTVRGIPHNNHMAENTLIDDVVRIEALARYGQQELAALTLQ